MYEKGLSEVTCDRVRDRALLLSQGLFGAPTSQPERDRAARTADKRAADAGRAR